MGCSNCLCSQEGWSFSNLWRLQGHDKSTMISLSRPIPTTQARRFVCYISQWKKFYKVRSFTSLLALVEDCIKYVTINTHQSLYQFTRIPFGISSAPAIFQRLMDKILHGLSGVICYIDDILITGKNEEEHL